MSDRDKVSALSGRAIAVRAVVEALVNETLSDGDEVDPEKLARLGLLAFEGEQEPPHEPLLAKAELTRFVQTLVADWGAR